MERREEDETVTPAGRFFLQPKMDHIIHCVVGLKLPIDIHNTKSELHNYLLKHPRFCSILVRDEHGIERWRKTEVDVDKHVVFPSLSQEDDRRGVDDDIYDDDEIVNGYLADLAVSSPLDLTKPPWEIHVLQSQRCCVLRLHHALGDSISLMSLFLAGCKRVDSPHLLPTIPGSKLNNKSSSSSLPSLSVRLWKWVMVGWLTFLYVVELILHGLWMKGSPTAISGGAGVELWPRKVVLMLEIRQQMRIKIS